MYKTQNLRCGVVNEHFDSNVLLQRTHYEHSADKYHIASSFWENLGYVVCYMQSVIMSSAERERYFLWPRKKPTVDKIWFNKTIHNPVVEDIQIGK